MVKRDEKVGEKDRKKEKLPLREWRELIMCGDCFMKYKKLLKPIRERADLLKDEEEATKMAAKRAKEMYIPDSKVSDEKRILGDMVSSCVWQTENVGCGNQFM